MSTRCCHLTCLWLRGLRLKGFHHSFPLVSLYTPVPHPRLAYTTTSTRSLRVRVELWDKDTVTKDDFVGAGVVDVTSVVRHVDKSGAAAAASETLVVALSDRTGRHVGEVDLVVSNRVGVAATEASALPPVAGVFEVWVCSAVNLKSMDMLSKQDPYVTVSLLDAGGKTVRAVRCMCCQLGFPCRSTHPSSVRLAQPPSPALSPPVCLFVCVLHCRLCFAVPLPPPATARQGPHGDD